MNYLGHIYLSKHTPEIMVGNLVTDMLELHEVRQLKGEYAKGVQLHKWIDRYTDRDTHVKKITQIFAPVQRKYAPVTSDIIFDFLIAHNWYRFADEAYEDFCNTVYRFILLAKSPMPKRINSRLERMVQHRWLHQQASWDGLEYTLQKMDERTRFPSTFHKATEQLQEHFTEINRLFLKFFRSIESDCQKWSINLRN